MSSCTQPAHTGPGRLSRRRLLGRGLGVGAALLTVGVSGCTPSDPSVSTGNETSLPSAASSTSTRPKPSAPRTPEARSSALASGEQQLADLAAAVLSGPRGDDLSKSQRRFLTALRDAHLRHVAALRSPQPTTRPMTPGATATPGNASSSVAKLSVKKSLSLLARREKSQAAAARRVATDATGFDALLSGSISVAARSYAAALTSEDEASIDIADEAPRPMTAVSDVAGVQSMVRQLHALVYGYQIALGRLSRSSADGRRAIRSLRRHRELRDRLEDALVKRSASVPAAAGAYVPTVKPTTAGRSRRLIRGMEVAFQPFCGLWLASATTGGDRRLALKTLEQTMDNARAWGADLTVWPGWQDP